MINSVQIQQTPCNFNIDSSEPPTLTAIYSQLKKIGIDDISLDADTPDVKRSAELLHLLLDPQNVLSQVILPRVKKGSTEEKVVRKLIAISLQVKKLDGDSIHNILEADRYYHSGFLDPKPLETANDFIDAWKSWVSDVVYYTDTEALTGFDDLKYRINHFFNHQ